MSNHASVFMNKNKYVPLVLAALLGGLAPAAVADEAPTLAQQVHKPRAGDSLYGGAAVAGTPILEQTYRYYGIDSQGNLLDDPSVTEGIIGYIALLESRNALPAQGGIAVAEEQPVPAEAMKAFYKAYFTALAAYYPNKDAYHVAGEVGDMDFSIEDIYREATASGLSIADYVAFYEAVDKYLPDGNAEGSLHAFLKLTGQTPAGLLAALGEAGVSWDGLLAKMAEGKAGFGELGQGYVASHQVLADYLAAYMKGDGSFADTASSVVEAAEEAAKLGLDVVKFSWDVIKEGKPSTTAEGAYTSVLSAKDSAYENYGYAKQTSSPKVTYWKGDIFGETGVSVDFRLSGYYGAVHPSIGGRWMPSIAFTVDGSKVNWSWKLNANAAITSAVNLGSTAAPQPEIQVIATMQASNWFQSFSENFTFYANGEKGFRTDSMTSLEVDSERVFNWAESVYPSILYPADVSAYMSIFKDFPLWSRCYESSGICLGTALNTGEIYYSWMNYSAQTFNYGVLGTVSGYLPQAIAAGY